MTLPGKQVHAVTPADPVQAALDDPEVRSGLVEPARPILGRWLADRPASIREDAAAAAVQETHLRAPQKRNAYNTSLPFLPWLHGMMNKVLQETARKLRRWQSQAIDDSAAWEQLAADLAPETAEAVLARLTAAEYVAQLPPEHRSARLRTRRG